MRRIRVDPPVEDRARVGVCLDTCHSHAAGYDLVTPEGFRGTLARFDDVVGLVSLRGMHLNDALKDRSSRVDRHAGLGKGTIGLEPFRRIMREPRFDGIPLILETPDETRWPQEIGLLKSYAEPPSEPSGDIDGGKRKEVL